MTITNSEFRVHSPAQNELFNKNSEGILRKITYSYGRKREEREALAKEGVRGDGK